MGGLIDARCEEKFIRRTWRIKRKVFFDKKSCKVKKTLTHNSSRILIKDSREDGREESSVRIGPSHKVTTLARRLQPPLPDPMVPQPHEGKQRRRRRRARPEACWCAGMEQTVAAATMAGA
uniref:Uncharacterized protein n=1 Tax=Oryza brachyantha TaxID=4533 RepID=J3LEN6_ORYBR